MTTLHKKKSAPHLNPLCNNVVAVAFVKDFLDDSKILAASLDMPVENILGLAAQESEWGAGRIAKTYNNYFSMHAPSLFQNGETPALRNPAVRVATYDSFLTCGKSFIARFGKSVSGIKDPTMFANALIKAGFNTGNSKTGGRDDFANYLVTIIKNTKIRVACP